MYIKNQGFFLTPLIACKVLSSWGKEEMLTFSCVLCVKSAVQLTQLGPGSVGQGMSPAPGEWWGVWGGTPLPLLSPYQRRLVIRLCKQLLLFWFSCDLRLFPPFFFFPDYESSILPRVLKCEIFVSVGECSGIFWISAKDTNSVTSHCYQFCVAVSSGGAAYFCNNNDNIS